jgi:hypothetical protein
MYTQPFDDDSQLPLPDQAVMNSRASASASQLQARKHNSNVVHGPLAQTYQHMERYFEGEDQDACARVNWHECNAIDLWNLLTSKFLSSGKTSSMAFSFRECLKKLSASTEITPLQKACFTTCLAETNDKHLPMHAGLKDDFISALSKTSTLANIRTCMEKYHSNKKIRIKDGLFPKFTDRQCNTVRIALFMVSSCTQQILHAMSNPSQSNVAMNNAETRVVAVRTESYKQFTDIVNSDDAPDQKLVDMSDINGIVVDCSCRLGPPMNILEVSTIMRDIKKDMSTLMRNFNGSGKLANGLDDYERDLEFYDAFAKGDALIFAVYLAWGHGRNIPAWNSVLLPPAVQLDTCPPAASGKGTKRARVACNDDDNVPSAKLDKIIDIQTKFFEYALKERTAAEELNNVSSFSSYTTNNSEVARIQAVDAQVCLLNNLQRLRENSALSREQRQILDAKFEEVLAAVQSCPVRSVTAHATGAVP